MKTKLNRKALVKENAKLVRHNMELRLVYLENLAEMDRVNKEFENVRQFIELNYNHDFWESFKKWSKR